MGGTLMALSLLSTKERYSDRFVKGLQIMTIQVNVGAGTDYSVTAGSEGLDLRPLTMGTIVDALGGCWKLANGTIKPFALIFDPDTNRLRAFKGSAGALVEIVQGDIAANDYVSVTIIGG